jgi:outer membrane protein OmpA-like peptidoglycan-associated protein
MRARQQLVALCLPAALFLGAPTEVWAGPGEDGTESEPESEDDSEDDSEPNVSVSTSIQVDASDQSRRHLPWIKRWAPEPHMLELGVYGGIMLLAETHELFGADLNLPEQGYKPLNRVIPDLGVRVGYYPLRFFGVEAEGGVLPASLADGSGPATLYTVRGHLVGQLGLWSITPFVVLGGGGLGVSSPRDALGKDIDPALHFGGGVKFYVHRLVMVRLDVRDVVTHKQSLEAGFISHNLEALLGLSITLGRRKIEPLSEPRPEPVNDDRDGDGIPNDLDGCPDVPETVNGYQDTDGCPDKDTDGDGIFDELDACVNEAETVNGFEDEDGCPEADTDNDGFFDNQDSCPTEPETDNGYKDADGCPDVVPDEVARFTGAIEGITFDNDKATIRKSSTKALDDAVKVLTDHPDIRIEISGHTDIKGDRDHNLDLSQRRAESVKQYLVEHGVDETRITTIGHGPDKPVDTNDTEKGRANNRRIEFKPITRKGRGGG